MQLAELTAKSSPHPGKGNEARVPLTDQNPPRSRRRAFDWSTASIAVIALAAAITVYFRDGQAHFLAVLMEDFWLLGDMLPKVVAGCLIAVFITFLLPREFVSRWIGEESGLFGLVIAAIMGSILPGGPITIYPVAGALIAVGADGGAVVALLTSWTLVGYTRALVWEMPFFGADFVLWRILLSMPLPLLAGIVARIAIRAFALKLGADE